MRHESLDASFFSADICELFRLFHLSRVKYLVVGGEAVIYYGHVRLTGDIDFFYDTRVGNIKRLHAALHEFWSGNIPGVSDFAELAQPDSILQFGIPPKRVDLMNAIDGVEFDQAWSARTEVQLELDSGSVPIYFIGLDDLITNKRSADREKDRIDLKYLLKVR